MTRLFFDIDISGHHSEYIGHIVNYIIENPSDTVENIFIVHPEFTNKFKEIVSKTEEYNHLIKWYPITRKELDTVTNIGMVKKSIILFNLMNHYAIKHDSDQVYLLSLNFFQFSLMYRRPKYSIKGILFKQFVRMSKDTWKEKIRYYRKYLTTKIISKNTSIDAIFILNDDKTVNYLNKTFKVNIFKMLPDPIPALKGLNGFNIFEHYKIERESKVFLHIGSLSDRKGTFEVIDSSLLLPKNEKIVFLIVGKASDLTTETRIRDKINAVNSIKKKNPIIWDNQFVSSPVMKSLFDQCDVVLLPYKSPEASSGILGHAIAAQKPVIATGNGLLKEIVQKYNFGWLLPKITAPELAKSVVNASRTTLKNSDLSGFLDSHAPNEFSKILLET